MVTCEGCKDLWPDHMLLKPGFKRCHTWEIVVKPELSPTENKQNNGVADENTEQRFQGDNCKK
jgi:hypothetical protein